MQFIGMCAAGLELIMLLGYRGDIRRILILLMGRGEAKVNFLLLFKPAVDCVCSCIITESIRKQRKAEEHIVFF